MTPTVVVGSGNPVKREATRRAFRAVFPGGELRVLALPVPSGVPDQPYGEEATRRGARNRADAARQRRPGAHWWVGIEGGVAEVEYARGSTAGSGREGTPTAGRPRRPGDRALYAFARVVVRTRGRVGESSSGWFRLPGPVAARVAEGQELGEADDAVFGREGSKRAEGAVGLLTRGAVTRADLYAQAVCLALVPFLHPEFYAAGE